MESLEPDIGGSLDGVGRGMAILIKSKMLKINHSIPQDGKYLGLAAGQAYPELVVARDLGLAMGNVTLVDRCFSLSAQRRFEDSYSGVKTVTSGLFEFLDSPPERDFSMELLVFFLIVEKTCNSNGNNTDSNLYIILRHFFVLQLYIYSCHNNSFR